jgi:hypothetical protein
MEWRAVVGFQDYAVSENGDVVRVVDGKTRKAGHVLTPKKESTGHLRVKLSINGKKQLVSVHRIVAMAFHGEPVAGQVCRHLDGNPMNNHFTNLKWGTCLENHDDRRRHGRSFNGERNGRARLTQHQAEAIRAEYDGSYGCVARLARKYRVGWTTINDIVAGRKWAGRETQGVSL